MVLGSTEFETIPKLNEKYPRESRVSVDRNGCELIGLDGDGTRSTICRSCGPIDTVKSPVDILRRLAVRYGATI